MMPHAHTIRAVLLLLLAGLPAQAQWETWTEARLVEGDYLDGDSFNVRKDGGRYTYTIRLYGADAPETDQRFPDRVKEQADYWGITVEQALQVGEDAAAFSRRFLADGFTVRTKKQDAMGGGTRNRYFGFVEAAGMDMGVALVSNGLARVFGVYTDLPNGVRWEIYRARLNNAERDAKANQRGAWALRAGASATPPGAVLSPPSITPAAPSGVVTLARPLTLYDRDDVHRVLGILQAGGQVEVKGAAERAGMLSVEVITREGQRIPGLCFESSLAPR